MKIIYAGNNNPNFINSNVYRSEAIRSLDHDVLFFEDRDFLIPGRIRQKIDWLHSWDLQRLNNKLIEKATKEKPDLCVIVGGGRILSQTLNKMKKMKIKIVLWTTDPPVFFSNIIKTAHLYDHILCSGTEAIEILKKEGLNETHWVPFACDPKYHKPVALSLPDKKKYKRDISFVGSYYENRAKIFEPLAKHNIGIWGPYWDLLNESSPLKENVTDIKLNYPAWRKIYSASKIVIVSHYNDGKTPCYQASPKLFEAMACGAFVMVDNQKDVKKLFTDGKHLAVFKNKKDLTQKVAHYLANPQQRNKIAKQGLQEVTSKHTYSHRAKRLFEIIKCE